MSKGVFAENMGSRDVIRDFIFSNFIKGDESKTLVDDISFLDEGLIDSVGVLELVAFLESTFGFVIEDEEIIPENLDSVDRLVAFVETKSTDNQL